MKRIAEFRAKIAEQLAKKAAEGDLAAYRADADENPKKYEMWAEGVRVAARMVEKGLLELEQKVYYDG